MNTNRSGVFGRLIGMFLLVMIVQGKALAIHSDPSIEVIKRIKNPKERLIHLLEYARTAHQSKVALELSEWAINIADSLNMPSSKALALEHSGVAWKKWGNPTKSIDRLNQALSFYLETNDVLGQSRVKRLLAETYRAANSLDLALIELNAAHALHTEFREPTELALLYNRFAAVYFEILINKPDFKSILVKEQLNSDGHKKTRAIADSLNKYLALSFEYANRYNLPQIEISSHNIQASISTALGNYDRAYEIYELTLSKIEQYDLKEDLPLIYLNKANLLGKNHMNKLNEAIILGEKGLAMAINLNIFPYIRFAHQILGRSYEALGNYEKAFFHIDRIIQLNKEYEVEDVKQRLASMNFEFEMRQRELDIEFRKLQLSILAFSFVGFIFVFSLFAWVLLRKNRKQDVLFNQVRIQNEIISKQNEDLEVANKEKNKLFSIIAHDLRDPFNSVMGFSELLADQVNQGNYDDTKEFANLILLNAQKSMDLLTNLMTWARTQTGRMEFTPQAYSLAEIVKEAVFLLKDNAKRKSIAIHHQIVPSVLVYVDITMLSIVLRNIIANAIKFTHEEGVITIQAIEKDNQVIIKIADNGIGMPPEMLETLFEVNFSNNRKGTKGELSTGLGLVLCKEFIEKHGGEIKVESKLDAGTTFFFNVPKAKSLQSQQIS